jgi:hypothetical protein
MTMRTSIIAGLALCAAIAAAPFGPARAYTNQAYKPADAAHRHRIARADAARAAPYATQFWIPAHPLIHDCMHVLFPQCSRGGLNDGSFR